jgi:hypothetical protein
VTEQEWLACTDPQKMLEFLVGLLGDQPQEAASHEACQRMLHEAFFRTGALVVLRGLRPASSGLMPKLFRGASPFLRAAGLRTAL